MPRPRFGVRLPVNGPAASPEAITRIAFDAEHRGFDAVWTHDLIGWTRTQQQSTVYGGSAEMVEGNGEPLMFEPITTLAFVAGSTSRIRIGSSVISVPLRNPVLLAKQLASLDVLSGGRLIAGVGMGATKEPVSDYEVAGVPRVGRYERMAEYLEVMRRVWEDPTPSFAGRTVRLPPTEIEPKPVQRPLPLWMGGSGPKALGLAARFGTGWIPSWLDVDGFEERLPLLRSELRHVGRDPDEFTIAKDCYVCIDVDGDRAQARSAATIDLLLDGLDPLERDRRLGSMLVGSSEEIINQVAAFKRSGVTDFEMKFIYRSLEDLRDQMEAFANAVIPAV